MARLFVNVVRLVAIIACFLWIPDVRAQAVAEVKVRSDCLVRLEEYRREPNPGHFFYVEEPNSTKYRCGFSFEEPGEFDAYPGSARAAFTSCQNQADERGIKARCELIARGSRIVARSYQEAQVRQADAGVTSDAMRCGQTPLNRWFWLERAFCDLPWHGPAKASGVVIWNHGILGTVTQYSTPVPPVFRLLQTRGWDVLKIARNNLGENSSEQSLYRAVARTLEEVAARRREGYPRVILAGQSFGGFITLEAADSSKDVYGVVAMAPGVRTIGGAGQLDASVTERTVGHLSVDRLSLVFPRNDSMFGNVERGRSVASVLAGHARSFLLLDEKYDIVDHGGGTTGKFAIRYGLCLVRYLTSSEASRGPVGCQESPAERISVAKELLPKRPDTVRVARTLDSLTQDLKSLAGSWYGVLEPSGEVASFAIADVVGVGRRAMFSTVSGWRRGGLYEFSTGEGAVTFRLPGRGTVVVKGTTLTWTPETGTNSQTATLVPLPED
jgi:pimeloyl-ACP methyl ester carboxylesterase